MDLRNIRKTFDELVLSRLSDKILKVNNIHKDKELITEESMYNKQIIEVPFGSIIYSLGIEDEKPVIFAHVISRMDMKRVFIIDEYGWKGCDVNGPGKNEDLLEKYRSHLSNVEKSGPVIGFRKIEK